MSLKLLLRQRAIKLTPYLLRTWESEDLCARSEERLLYYVTLNNPFSVSTILTYSLIKVMQGKLLPGNQIFEPQKPL